MGVFHTSTKSVLGILPYFFLGCTNAKNLLRGYKPLTIWVIEALLYLEPICAENYSISRINACLYNSPCKIQVLRSWITPLTADLGRYMVDAAFTRDRHGQTTYSIEMDLK